MPKIKARQILGIIGVIGFIILTSAFFGILFFGSKVGIPEGEIGKQIIGMLGMVVGTWNSAFLTVIAFYFGSSQGSQDKGDVQSEVIKKLKVVGTGN